jgi:hypothetical protein
MITNEQYTLFSPYFAEQDTEDPATRASFLSAFDQLPQRIREFLTATETTEKVLSLGKNLGLDELDTETLSRIVRRLASGELFLGKAPEECQTELGIEKDAATKLLTRLLNEIFPPVIEDLKAVQRDTFISPVPKLKTPSAPRTAALIQPRRAPAPLPPSPMPSPPPPKPAAPSVPRQIANLGYLLQDKRPAPDNPGNVLDLRNQPK